MDILFDGIAIDCSGGDDNFIVKSTCVQMKERSGIRSVNATHLAFSLLGGVSFTAFYDFFNINFYAFFPLMLCCWYKANASSVGRFTVYRGVQDISKLGEVVTFNGEEEVDAWDDEKCNKITGTDSTVYV